MADPVRFEPVPGRSELVRMRKSELVELVEQFRPLAGMSVTAATSAALAEVGDMPGFDRAKGATALRLAVELDAGAGMATAAVARELRATLAELEAAAKERTGGGNDPAEDLDAELERLTAG